MLTSSLPSHAADLSLTGLGWSGDSSLCHGLACYSLFLWESGMGPSKAAGSVFNISLAGFSETFLLTYKEPVFWLMAMG